MLYKDVPALREHVAWNCLKDVLASIQAVVQQLLEAGSHTVEKAVSSSADFPASHARAPSGMCSHETLQVAGHAVESCNSEVWEMRFVGHDVF